MLAGQISPLFLNLCFRKMRSFGRTMAKNSPLPAAAHFEDATLELIKHWSDKCGRTHQSNGRPFHAFTLCEKRGFTQQVFKHTKWNSNYWSFKIHHLLLQISTNTTRKVFVLLMWKENIHLISKVAFFFFSWHIVSGLLVKMSHYALKWNLNHFLWVYFIYCDSFHLNKLITKMPFSVK